MKILRVDKDKVQVELTKQEVGRLITVDTSELAESPLDIVLCQVLEFMEVISQYEQD